MGEHSPTLKRHRTYWRYWSCKCGWYGRPVLAPDVPLLSVYMQHVPANATATITRGTLDSYRHVRPNGVTP